MNGYKVITSISGLQVGLLKHIYVVYAILCITMLCRSRYTSFPDYQDILTLWTSVLHNLLSECGNVGLFMVGLTRFDCILNRNILICSKAEIQHLCSKIITTPTPNRITQA